MSEAITYPPEMLPSPSEGDEVEVLIECSKCHGSGRYRYNTYGACGRCGGTGTINALMIPQFRRLMEEARANLLQQALEIQGELDALGQCMEKE